MECPGFSFMGWKPTRYMSIFPTGPMFWRTLAPVSMTLVLDDFSAPGGAVAGFSRAGMGAASNPAVTKRGMRTEVLFDIGASWVNRCGRAFDRFFRDPDYGIRNEMPQEAASVIRTAYPPT